MIQVRDPNIPTPKKMRKIRESGIFSTRFYVQVDKKIREQQPLSMIAQSPILNLIDNINPRSLDAPPQARRLVNKRSNQVMHKDLAHLNHVASGSLPQSKSQEQSDQQHVDTSTLYDVNFLDCLGCDESKYYQDDLLLDMIEDSRSSKKKERADLCLKAYSRNLDQESSTPNTLESGYSSDQEVYSEEPNVCFENSSDFSLVFPSKDKDLQMIEEAAEEDEVTQSSVHPTVLVSPGISHVARTKTGNNKIQFYRTLYRSEEEEIRDINGNYFNDLDLSNMCSLISPPSDYDKSNTYESDPVFCESINIDNYDS